MQLKIQARYLPVLKAFAANEDIRYYLKGFYAEPVKAKDGGGVLLVATNGHVLCVIHDVEGKADKPQIRPMSSTLVAAAKRKLKKIPNYPVEPTRYALFVDDAVHVVRGEVDDVIHPGAMHVLTEHAPPIDAEYPNWREVIQPDEPSDEQIGVDARYLALATTVAEAAGDPWNAAILFPSTPTNPLAFRLTKMPEFFALVMPMRLDAKFERIPPWLKLDEPKKSAKKSTKKKTKAA